MGMIRIVILCLKVMDLTERTVEKCQQPGYGTCLTHVATIKVAYHNGTSGKEPHLPMQET